MEEKIIKEQYKATAILGEDGVSIFYEGEDLKSGQKIWLEYFRAEFFDEALVQKLANLSCSLIRLNHSGIVKTLDFAPEEAGFWLILEKISGVSLARYLEEKQKLDFAEVSKMMASLIEALNFAARQLVNHGSLNLENIWLTDDQKIKIWGFALRTLVLQEMIARTSSLPVGTSYLAPEQLKGEFFQEASDLYSFGVIIYQLLTGQLPAGQSPDFSLVPAPAAFQEILARLLKENPKERLNSWEDLLKILDEKNIFKKEETATAPAPPAAEKKPPGKDKPKKEKKPGFWKKALGILFVFLVGAAAGFFLAYLAGPFNQTYFKNEVVVPEVKGLTLQDAENILHTSQLNPVFGAEVPSSQVEKGKVAYTDPEAASRAGRGTAVKVFLSSGANLIPAPKLTGLNFDQAQKAAEKLGLEIELSADSREIAQARAVILNQFPAPQSQLRTGDKIMVSFTKSKNLEQVTLLDFTGQDFFKAKSILKENNLNLGRIIYQNCPAEGKNKIFLQNPGAGAKILPMSFVDLVIGAGPEVPKIEIRKALVEFTLPINLAGKKIWLAEIKVEDTTGVYPVFQKEIKAAESIVCEVLGVGESTTRIYLNGQLINVQRF